ncbi:ferric iron uptake transcriptional regulator [Aquisalimonas sp. 2447]|uniref:ferric iron uptake transcriptional regulator n=1 Tax=Aquisalimonas sp. 2447 TaxID=2740807 RepID=UPI0014323002|nr:ferric iron uptake transcriptional regulator [Aquisalimonas sp. 2447]QIT55219.1 ferric iron uptake transcriptional regulator [Aquisalimonas sp. 2447]
MESRDLRKAGLKVTVPRTKVLDVLEQHSTGGRRHLSAEDVYKALLDAGEEIGLATVYRVLTQFEEAGLVRRHHFEGGQSMFELDDEPHDHIVCVDCGAIEEFHDPVVAERQRRIAAERGYEIADQALVIYGLCRNCLQRGD